MLFSQVKGQEELKQRIISVIDANHFPHAILLSGKDGYGNLAMALAVAQYISCTDKHHGTDSCGQCPSCRKYSRLIHPDLHMIFPTTTTSSVKANNESALFTDKFRQFVSENGAYCTLGQWHTYMESDRKQGVINVRDADKIVSQLTLKPYESNVRTMLIWNADKMNNDASDKILKILEEPYPNTVFILTTQHKERIIPTVLSRVQQITVPPIDNVSMQAIVKEMFPDISQDELNLKISVANGDFTALKNIDSYRQQELRQIFVDINRIAMMYSKHILELTVYAEELSKRSREYLTEIFDYYANTIDKCFLFNNNVSADYHPLFWADGKFKDKFPSFITANNIEGIYKLTEQTRQNIKYNANAKINLTDTLIKLGQLLADR